MALAAVERLGDVVDGQAGVAQVLADVFADVFAKRLQLGGGARVYRQFLQRQAHQLDDHLARATRCGLVHDRQLLKGAAHGFERHP
jgi:ubiquinone biosynthesis protein UbiJ